MCEAYGPEAASVGAVCFFGAGNWVRVCDTAQECHERMAGERRRVFRRINEMAAAGDETGEFLSEEFTSPEQLLGGADDD